MYVVKDKFLAPVLIFNDKMLVPVSISKDKILALVSILNDEMLVAMMFLKDKILVPRWVLCGRGGCLSFRVICLRARQGSRGWSSRVVKVLLLIAQLPSRMWMTSLLVGPSSNLPWRMLMSQ